MKTLVASFLLRKEATSVFSLSGTNSYTLPSTSTVRLVT